MKALSLLLAAGTLTACSVACVAWLARGARQPERPIDDGVAQPVEHQLRKPEAAGSMPVPVSTPEPLATYEEAALAAEVGRLGPGAGSLTLSPTVAACLGECTAETLYDSTAGLWLRQEGLWDLTGTRLCELLPEESNLGGNALRDLVGVPVRADVELAYSDPRVRSLHVNLTILDALLDRMDIEALDRGDPALFEATRADLRRTRDATLEELLAAMEHASGYRHWRLVHRAYVAWAR